jgi:hypothetical protein
MSQQILYAQSNKRVDIGLDSGTITVPASEVEVNVIKGDVEAFELVYGGDSILKIEESTFPSSFYDAYANVQEAFDSVLSELTSALV